MGPFFGADVVTTAGVDGEEELILLILPTEEILLSSEEAVQLIETLQEAVEELKSINQKYEIYMD